MRKKMAYFMHVDWKWIKQRPQFLAEELLAYYDIDLFYIRNMKVRGLIDNPLDEAAFHSVNRIRKLPYSSRSPWVQQAERWINRTSVKRAHETDYDYFWITSPYILHFIDIERIRARNIIYDCMDDILAFPQSEKTRNSLAALEKQLLKQSNLVFASSEHLKSKVEERDAQALVSVANNALSLTLAKSGHIFEPPTEKIERFTITYFGTISHWFDFDLLFKLLELHRDIQITIIGPSEVPLPPHERITYTGSIAHDAIKIFAERSDAFIMPFLVNELILSVDPVKVYEYIAFGKPAFVVEYPETLKFADFVYLYRNAEQLSAIIDRVKRDRTGKNSLDQIDSFLQQNHWGARARHIHQTLENSL
ncbi:hypothetical protein ACFPVX_06175 [Cohnella faecalis]|uniref:Glycosyltransferase n=1 Tax=Cohnella faecalis TaxID=2315694 RepID=A0A398CLJ2_9BACL|nr:glycosyltransferase family 1 protein [Cohnella faecalis]RIE02079.1 hypothetical protein D3H35_15065 [Cohnella faecalis]